MKSHARRLVLVCLFASLWLTACGVPTQPPTVVGSDTYYTQAAGTIEARLTQQGLQTAIVQLTQIASLPSTLGLPAGTILPPATIPTVVSTFALSTATLPPPPTDTPLPTLTPVPPTNTPLPIPCNAAQFMGDVTIKDGTLFTHNTHFTKIWRLKNTGACTWDSSYALVYAGGDLMGGAVVNPLRYIVQPGETIDIPVDFYTPNDPGKYQGLWILRDSQGEFFGTGSDKAQLIWVDIQVIIPSEHNFEYDFAANYCDATWRSSVGLLTCGDASTESEFGAVLLVDQPQFEGGYKEDELSLWTVPDETRRGWILGDYPPFLVKSGDHFLADVGCMADSPGCDITFYVDYQLQAGQAGNFGQWRQVYDGDLTRINIDLSPYADQFIELTLGVINNGKTSQANALWLAPSIRSTNP